MSQVDVVTAFGGRAWLRRFSQEVFRQSPFLVFGFGMLALSIFVENALSAEADTPAILRIVGFITFCLTMVCNVLPMLFFRLAMFDRADKPLKALIGSVYPFFTRNGRFLPGILTFAAIYAFISAFSQLKASITLIKPFAWDTTFDNLDRVLHFGYRPWELLAPLLNYAPVTVLINANYHLWFLGLSLYWAYFSFDEKPGVLRTRALIAYMLTWSIGGIALATFFSSAGPCFFGRLNLGYDPYAGLMTYLNTTGETWPVWALGVQEWLWTNYQNGSIDLAKGISAMPSMHNGQCLLLVLAVWNKGKLVRNLAIVHGVLVYLGSIQLGWHYAVDAYLAWIVAACSWVAAGWFARFWDARTGLSPAVSHR